MKNLNTDQINFYKKIEDKQPTKALSLFDLYFLIKNGGCGIKEIVTEVRKYDKNNPAHKSIIAWLKKELPAAHIPISPNFKAKVLQGLTKDALNGFVYFDIDKIPNIKDIKRQISQNKHISMVWLSASETGLGVIVKCDWIKDVIDFKKDLNIQYKQITKYLWDCIGLNSIEIDPAAQRLNQANYISYDSEVYYNPNAICDVEMMDKSLIKFDKEVDIKNIKNINKKAPITLNKISSNLTKDILDALHLEILNNEEDLKIWNNTNSGNSAINLLAPRAIQYGISVEDVYVYMQKYTIHSDKEKVYNLKEAGSYARSSKYVENYKKQLYTYSPISKTDVIYLKSNQYLSEVFDYKLFRNSDSNNVKAIIIASTGMGKNYAIVKNATKQKTIIVVPYNSLVDSVIKDAQSLNYTLIKETILEKYKNDLGKSEILFDNIDEKELNNEIENFNKVNPPINFVRFDQFATKEMKTNNLSDKNLIITTNESLPKVVAQLGSEINYSDIFKNYLLVIDEVHVYSYSDWKENSLTKLKPITECLEKVALFDNVIAMTGTYSDTPLKTFEGFKVVKFKYEVEPILRSFGFYIKGKGRLVDEDLKVVNYFKKQGYFPIIYKNDKKEDGWLGDFKTTAKNSFGYTFADINADSKKKRPQYYKEVVIDRNIDKYKYDGIIMTSIMKQGVSTNIKIAEGEVNKIVYIINATSKYDGIDSDEIQQIANRVRNATEVVICLTYPNGSKILNINDKVANFDYNYILEHLVAKQNINNNLYKKEDVANLKYGQYKRFQKIEGKSLSITQNGICENSDLYLAQELAKIRCKKEFSAPVYLGWLGFEKFGWNYLGLINMKLDLVVLDHTEHKQQSKEIKNQKAVDFADGVNFVCNMFDEVFHKTDIYEFNSFLNDILKTNKLPDGTDIENGFKQAILAAIQVQNKFKYINNYSIIKDLICVMTNNKASSKILEMLNTYSIYKDLKTNPQKNTNRDILYRKCFENIDNYEMPTNLFKCRLDAINSFNLGVVVDLYPIVETNTPAKKDKFIELLVCSFFDIARYGKDKITRKDTYKITKIDLYDGLVNCSF